MEQKNKTGLIIAIVVLSLLVVGLSGYLIYDKVLKDNETTEKNNPSTNNDGKENSTPYSVKIADICPSTGDCSKNLDDVTLDGNTYKVFIQTYDTSDGHMDENKTDYVTVNNQKLETGQYLNFIAVMNNEYLLVGSRFPAGDEIMLDLYDKNLNKVETFMHYNYMESFYETNMYNDKLLTFSECTIPDDAVLGDDNIQTLTTYSVEFNNGTYNKTKTSEVENTFCSAAR